MVAYAILFCSGQFDVGLQVFVAVEAFDGDFHVCG
jgi:hypothetical protein